MTETWHEREARMTAQAESDAALIRERLAEDEAFARSACKPTHGPHPDGDVTRWEVEPFESDDPGAWPAALWVSDGHEMGVAQVNPAGTKPQHIARHDPRRVLDQCGSLGDALGDLERIAERSPDPDSRMCARSAIANLRRIWEPDE